MRCKRLAWPNDGMNTLDPPTTDIFIKNLRFWCRLSADAAVYQYTGRINAGRHPQPVPGARRGGAEEC